jgi:hypothetical protein
LPVAAHRNTSSREFGREVLAVTRLTHEERESKNIAGIWGCSNVVAGKEAETIVSLNERRRHVDQNLSCKFGGRNGRADFAIE